MKPGFFAIFVLPIVALACFLHGGVWTWAFAPVLAGLGLLELAACFWKRRGARSSARDLAAGKEMT